MYTGNLDTSGMIHDFRLIAINCIVNHSGGYLKEGRKKHG